jgi:hypothetical protein
MLRSSWPSWILLLFGLLGACYKKSKIETTPFVGAPSADTQATGRRSHFAWEVSTTASPERVWSVWTDVARWPTWDTELERASLKGDFISGSQGELKGKGSPVSVFWLEDVQPQKGYQVITRLPLGSRLVIERTLFVTPGGTRFRHEISFHGAFGRLLALMVGDNYRRALPRVMDNIRVLAEAP